MSYHILLHQCKISYNTLVGGRKMFQTIFGAIIGIITSYVFYIVSRTRSRINYQTSNLQIIGNISLKLPQDFEVTMSGVKINSLHKSQIVVWNGGNTTITGDSIVKDDPLRIVFSPGTKIFDFNITALSRKVNKFVIKNFNSDITENELLLDFDFMDKKDGVMIEVLHTESIKEPILNGTIKGLKNGIKNKGQINYLEQNQKINRLKNLFNLLIGLISSLIIGTALYILIFVFGDSFKNESAIMNYLSLVIGVFIPIVCLSNGFFINKRKFPKSINNLKDFKD